MNANLIKLIFESRPSGVANCRKDLNDLLQFKNTENALEDVHFTEMGFLWNLNLKLLKYFVSYVRPTRANVSLRTVSSKTRIYYWDKV